MCFDDFDGLPHSQLVPSREDVLIHVSEEAIAVCSSKCLDLTPVHNSSCSGSDSSRTVRLAAGLREWVHGVQHEGILRLDQLLYLAAQGWELGCTCLFDTSELID